jgi:hypothetical protein
VTLYNLKVLLDVFPTKPFYLTEFAYDTEYSEICGLHVSRADQARYLRKAYQRVARWKQVKALFWYLVADWAPFPERPARALYLGLIEKDGVTRKPAWYAFAGSNRLTMATPLSAAAGSPFAISGTLTTKLGPLEDVTVTLQSRDPASRRWTDRGTAPTGIGGTFSLTVTQNRSRTYRVVWDGVCESASRIVKAR